MKKWVILTLLILFGNNQSFSQTHALEEGEAFSNESDLESSKYHLDSPIYYDAATLLNFSATQNFEFLMGGLTKPAKSKKAAKGSKANIKKNIVNPKSKQKISPMVATAKSKKAPPSSKMASKVPSSKSPNNKKVVAKSSSISPEKPMHGPRTPAQAAPGKLSQGVAEGPTLQGKVEMKSGLTSNEGTASLKDKEKPKALATEVPESFRKAQLSDFQYRPVDLDFWTELGIYKEKSDMKKYFSLAAARFDELGISTPEGAEAKYGIAEGLRSMGYFFAAFAIYKELAKTQNGTFIGEASMQGLNLIAQETFYDHEDIYDLVNSNEFGPMHPETQSFVSYHKSFLLRRFDLPKWEEAEIKKISEGSFWDLENKYIGALKMVQEGEIEEAKTVLEELIKNPKMSNRKIQEIRLQLARLDFENADFEAAHEKYTNLDQLPVRERGRVGVERAWTKYYQKDYSKTLGILASLEAPFYDASPSFERYILKTIILRDLCHYDLVKGAAEEFRNRFGRSLASIRERKPLNEDRGLLRLALMDKDIQEDANLIDKIRREREGIQNEPWKNLLFVQPLLNAYRQKDSELQMRIDRGLEDRVRKYALDLLDVEEQINFIEYTSKMDELRIIRQAENRDYSSEKIKYFEFNKFYWPVKKEFWLDEFESMKVLIGSKCRKDPNTILPATQEEEDFR